MPASLTERWAEPADLVLSIAREIQFHGYASPEAISLSIPEGMVMRYLLELLARIEEGLVAMRQGS
jgi:hypothetical protein